MSHLTECICANSAVWEFFCVKRPCIVKLTCDGLELKLINHIPNHPAQNSHIVLMFPWRHTSINVTGKKGIIMVTGAPITTVDGIPVSYKSNLKRWACAAGSLQMSFHIADPSGDIRKEIADLPRGGEPLG